MQETESGGHWKSAPWSKGPVAYKATADLVVPTSGHTVRLEVGPKTKTPTHTLRLEFNPTALGAPGIAFLKKHLEELVPDGLSFAHIIANGKITRLDVAVDLVGISLTDLLVSAKSGGKQHWYLSATGKPETGYLGIGKSDKNAKWKTYNKRQQVKDTVKTLAEPAYGGLSHTRVEYTYTPMKSFLHLGKLENRFTEFSVAYPMAPKGVKSHQWAFFIDSCSRRGEKAASALLPEGTLRSRYEKALVSAHASFWRPEKIWEAWPEALVNCGLLIV